MKSLKDHVEKLVIHIGKYKDMPLTEVTDLDWLDWYVKSDYSSKWQKKLVNWYIDDIAKDIIVKTEANKEEERKESAKLDEELKDGKWVDENF
jgi:hypothetical protein